MATTHVVTGKVRLSYTHLTKPYARNADQEPKYSCTVLVPKSDTATMAKINEAIAEAKRIGKDKKWDGIIPPIVAVPVHDGDGARPSDGMPFGDECKGHWVFTASSKNAPAIVDVNLNRILDETEIYSGIYARVAVDFFAYSNAGKKGIGCGLANVQKLADGDSLAGGTTAEQDFGTPVADTSNPFMQ